MHGKQGFTLLELLIVLGILGIILGISVISGQRILRGQEERAALHSFRQAVTRAATAANSRNINVALRFEDNEIVVLDVTSVSQKVLQTYPIPESVDTGIEADPFLEFGADGKVGDNVEPDDLRFTFVTASKAYDLEVSLIGEVKVTPK